MSGGIGNGGMANGDMRTGGLRPILIAVLALAAVTFGLNLSSEKAEAATPTILNTGSNWLETLSSLGETNNSANRLWVSLAVKHDVGRKVTGIKIDDDWNGTDNTTSKTVKVVTAQQPPIQGGYDHSRISYNYAFPTSDTGLGCGAFGVGGTNLATKPIRIRAILDNGEETATSSSNITFTRADCSGGEDFPYLYQRSQTAQSVNVGGSVTFTYRGDDSDGNGNSDFAGVNWRMRRLSDGATTTAVKRCYTAPFDNTDKTLAITFPERGRWVVEAELLNNSGCNTNNNAGTWAWIGAVDVNTAAATSPTVNLTATRPQINGNSTVSATFADTSDSAEGGRVQNAEWDLDGNGATGISGFEVADLGTWNANLSSPRSKTVNTTGMSPGLKTVRVKVGDNGALVGADNIRRTVVDTATYLVDTPPVATAQTTSARAGTGKAITVAGTDVDDDSLTFSVATQPANGTLSGTAPNLTYIANADFAGTDTFTFTANDGFGGTDTDTVTVEVSPSTTIDPSTPTSINTTSASFTFSSQVPGATFECRFEPNQNPVWEACTSPFEVEDLTEGAHVFEVRAVAEGLTDPTPASRTLNVYLTPPVSTIDSGPTGPTANDSPQFAFSSNVPGSTFECRLEFAGEGEWEACATPKSYTDLIDGAYTFFVRATDPGGNVETGWANSNFQVDATAPETSIDSAPAAITNSGAASFTFSSPEPTATFECRLDSGNWEACESPQDLTGLADGAHEYSVRALDALGNRDATPAVHNWTIDRVAPVITITAAPESFTTEADGAFEFTANETATFECSLDDADWAACASPVETNGLSGGSHSFRIRATDSAGNLSIVASHNWTIDLTAPETTIDSGPAAIGNSSQVSFAFSADQTGSSFECRLDSTDEGDWQACASPVNYTALADGSHTFEVRATDQAENVDATPASFNFVIDTGAPDTTMDSAPDAESSTPNPVFEFSSDDPSATFECRLDGSGNDPFAACESPKSYLGLGDGNHTIEIRAVDTAGNRDSSPVSFSWLIDSQGPILSFDAKPADPTNQNEASFEISANENGTTFECRLDSEDEGAWESCGSAVDLGILPEGRHTFEARGTDRLGTPSTGVISWSWTIDQTDPVVAINSGPALLTNQGSASFEFTSDAGATFECRIDSVQATDWAACVSPFTTNGVGEGEHKFEVRATDLAGNLGDPMDYSWEVDQTAPDVTIDSGPDPFTNQTTATFNFSTPDASATFECRLDAGNWADCNSPVAYEDLAEGQHSFRVRATDGTDNTGSVAVLDWQVILTPPVATINSAPPVLTNSATANFTFSADNSQATFECRLDSGEETGWEDCASPKALNGLTDGVHKFEIRATDGLGNVSDIASYQWTVDLTAPAVSIDSGPASTVNVQTASIAFSSADNGATFECRLDTGNWDDCESPAVLTGLAAGAHTFQVRATDEAGNTGAADEHNWFVDLTAPVATIDSGPPGLGNSTTATFTFSSTEDGTFECRLDSTEESGWESCVSPKELTDLTEGAHKFELRATDEAGNVSTVKSQEWTVDLTAPTVTFDSTPPVLTKEDSGTFEFSSSDPDATFECRLDSDSETSWIECDSPRDLNDLTDGQHVFEVRASDAAGNTGAAATHTWTVDLGLPTVTIDTAPETLNNETSAVIEFSSDDADATFECRIDSATNGEWEACDSPAGYTNLTDGSYTFHVRATDEAGNVGQEANVTWTVDLTAPVITIDQGPAASTNSKSAAFEFSSNEPGTSFECRIDSDDETDWADCDSPATYPALADGSHKFEVRGTDPAGNEATTDQSWTIDTVLPVVEITSSPANRTKSTDASFAFSSDKNGSTYECRIDSDLPGGWEACESGKSYNGLTEGDHVLEVRATDGLGNIGDAATREWTIDLTAPVTTIDSGPQSVTSSTTAEFTFSSEAGATFECRIDGQNSGGWDDCVSGFSQSAVGTGEHKFEVRATDDVGNTGTAVELAWTVDNIPPAASIASGPEGPVSSKQARFTFSSADAAGSFECRVDSELETGWETCQSPFDLNGLDEGEHRFQVRAVGQVSGPGGVASRTWTVDTVAPAIAITAGPEGSTRQTNARFEFSSDDQTATLSCRIDSDAAIDWQSCESPRSFAGIPDGNHVLEVRATDAAGNETVVTRSWKVDTVAPVVTITSKPAASTTSTDASFAFVADKPGSAFECALDGAAWKGCASPVNAGPAAAGDHTFAVKATDSLGNASETVTYSWKVTTVVEPQPIPKVPTVKPRRKVKLNRAGRAAVATLGCPEGTCVVKAPKKVTLKIGKRKFKARLVGRRSISAGRFSVLRIVLPKPARRAVGKRAVRVTIKVVVTSTNGKAVARTFKVVLRAGKPGRKQ